MNLKNIIDYILPRICPACHNALEVHEEFICNKCVASLPILNKATLDAEYNKKFFRNGYIDELFSLYLFERNSSVQSLIHSVKYGKRFQNGMYLGRNIAQAFPQKIISEKIDIIIPVPLHILKRTERGYNQSYYIANGISQISGIPVDKGTLIRHRFTYSQTMLTIDKRQENVKGAFAVKNSKNIENKRILLVDDVITTGATISECGEILLAKGATKVFAASAALVL